MSTGIFNPTASLTTKIRYSIPNSYTLPYTNYPGLEIVGGNGIKTLSGNTNVYGTFILSNNAILELGNNNFTVYSGSQISGLSGVYALTKSGSGTVSFSQSVYLGNYGSGVKLIDFSSGSPDIEFKGGFYADNLPLLENPIKTGTGSMYFSTSNQSIYWRVNTNSTFTIDSNFIISGSINLTVGNGNAFPLQIMGRIDGTSANSTMSMAANSSISYYNSIQPMLTGTMDVSTNLNTFTYASGSQDVKGGIYRNLTFLNGLKTLQGNVSVLGTFSTGSGATSGGYNLNGFTLTNP